MLLMNKDRMMAQSEVVVAVGHYSSFSGKKNAFTKFLVSSNRSIM